MDIVKYTDDMGRDVSITPQDVRSLICDKATDKEVALFIELCKSQRLNPFAKDAYLVKYGTSPASMITSKEVFTKRAQANPKFEGMQCGVTLIINGQVVQREGSMVLPGWELVGGWCKVYVKGYRVPIYDEVSVVEYGTGNGNWKTKPATMIRKVAMVHALREAFPDMFQGLYDACEMGDAGELVPEEPSDEMPVPAEAEEAHACDDEVVVEAEPVDEPEGEYPTLEQMTEYTALVAGLAKRRHVSKKTVEEGLFGSQTMAGFGLQPGAVMKREECEAALGLLRKWNGYTEE